MENMILERYKKVKENIELACLKAGRSSHEVQLIIVTKGFNADSVLKLEKTDNEILGENYPEETIKKIKEINLLSPTYNPVWHMIGHLQSRKVKLMYPHFAMIHSIDSVHIAEKVNNSFINLNRSIDVLLEINIAGEPTKYGFNVVSEKERDLFLQDFLKMTRLSNISIKGLMCMPPYAKKEDQNRCYYEDCKKIRDSLIKETKIESLEHLSMGTSADYFTAIQCGATMVRVGEAIMGNR
jgi:pyridoxal phosphate enzyme (YggS family)